MKFLRSYSASLRGQAFVTGMKIIPYLKLHDSLRSHSHLQSKVQATRTFALYNRRIATQMPDCCESTVP